MSRPAIGRPAMSRTFPVELKLIGQGLLPVLLMVAVVYLVGRFGLLGHLDRDWLLHQVADHPLAGNLVFIALTGLLTASGTPRQLIAFSGGYVFGAAMGTVISTIATTLGAIACYYVARLFLAPIIERGIFRQRPGIGDFLQRDTFRKTLIVRLFPVGNNLVTNVVAGSSAAPPLPFVTGSFLGYLPQMLIFALTGSGVSVASEVRVYVGLALFCISTWMSVRIYRNSGARQVL